MRELAIFDLERLEHTMQLVMESFEGECVALQKLSQELDLPGGRLLYYFDAFQVIFEELAKIRERLVEETGTE